MAEERRPQLRIDPQQFAQEVAAEIAADLKKQAGRNAARSAAKYSTPLEEVSQRE
ncbi:MAG: hypothetical protein M0Z66_03500 [Thermaerobacter sp.]|nr:hypothetical protein [Thermaerobacter sp.]